MAKVSTNEEWREVPRPFTLKLLEPPPGMEPERRADLLATIHERLIPELIVAHWEGPIEAAECPDSRPPPTDKEVYDFARIAVAQNLTGALAFVESLAAQGVSLEVVLLHLIAPAARLRGREWEDDTTTWADVTIGLGTLQHVAQVFGPSFAPGVGQRGLVVLVAAPREQHTLGIYLLGELLRRADWGVHVEPSMPHAELVMLVGAEPVEMVGFSASTVEVAKPLVRTIAAIKKASINPNISIMLGGSPELADDAPWFGATFCSDPQEVVQLLERRAKLLDGRRS